MGHSLVCSLVCSHHSLVRLLRPTRFTCALLCAHLLAHFAHSLAPGKVKDWMGIFSVFFSILDHSGLVAENPVRTKWGRFTSTEDYNFDHFKECSRFSKRYRSMFQVRILIKGMRNYSIYRILRNKRPGRF